MPVRKVKLKDGSIGYQWGTTGKIYKKREDAERQGLAILLSQRKKMKKSTYNELKKRVEELEKLVNGGKGSGNFGHSGRPGKVGGSAPEGSATSETSTSKSFDGYKEHQKHNFEVEGYTSSTAELKEFFPEGSEFYFDGDHFTVQDGENGLEGVSDDGKRVVSIPSETLDQTSDYVGKGENPTKRLSAFQEIVSKMRDHGFPVNLCDEIGRYAVAEHDLFATDKDKTEGLKRVDSYADSARGGIMGCALGNGGIEGPMSNYNQRLLKAISEQIYRGQRGAHEALENEATNSFVPAPQQLAKSLNGGKGSGNFGHAGRPGELGGSAPSGSGIKGGTKAEHEAIKSLLKGYVDEERGFEGVLEDAKAAGYPNDTNYQKALRWVEGGGAGISYYDAYQDLKAIYGDGFKPETYLTKGGNEDNGDWKYKDGEPYVWTIYKAKLAKAIADEMDKRENMNKNIYKELIAKIDNLAETIVKNGGKGSGNFGHAGRPGKVGGSSSDGLGGGGQSEIDKKIERAKDYAETSSDRSASWVEEADREAARDLGLEPYTMAPTKGEFWQEAIAILEARKDQQATQSKEQKLAEIREKNRQKREAEALKAKAEREEHIKQIDKIIGSEKITEGETKAEDDKNYEKLGEDIREIKRILAKEKSRENFGQDEVRKLKDKYSDYMYGNYEVTGRFRKAIDDFDDWASNYVNW